MKEELIPLDASGRPLPTDGGIINWDMNVENGETHALFVPWPTAL